MRAPATLIFALLTGTLAHAQTPVAPSLSGEPVEITSSGGTTYNGGVAIARENVAVHAGDADIYADEAEYDSNTHDVRLRGHVRIYRGFEFYLGTRGTYNTETKKITADDLRSVDKPFFVHGERVATMNDGGQRVEKGSLTLDDSDSPDFQIRASSIRFYEGDRVILKNATLYVGRVPIFYWPYLYQSLDDSFSFLISPAYTSTWGASLLTQARFAFTENIRATFRLDLRARRGVALGFAPYLTYGKDKTSYAKIRTYFARDDDPTINRTALPRGAVPTGRYRLSLEDRTNFTHDLSGFVNITKLSDAFLLQDFFQSEFRVDPQPDNVVVLKKYNPLYTLTLDTRAALNNFYDVTERLPELALDVVRQPIFHSPFFYESDTSAAFLQRNFAHGSIYQDYDAFRFDTFHQITFPNTYFGWLSVVPRVGLRETYYSETRELTGVPIPPNPVALIPDFLIPPPTLANPLQPGGDRFRTVVNAGVEASFKVSRTWENAQSRALGLDGLRHVIEPFANFSYVTGNDFTPAEILQFDRYIPSTRARPIDFPQFSAIDSLDNWSIARIGVRNRLQTRRDDGTINWLELETYFDVNLDNPYNKSDYSNVYNNLRFNPVPWIGFGVASQLPLLTNGFTEVDTDVRVQPTAKVQFALSHRYLNENPFFANSSLYAGRVYYRINDNWGAGASAQYENSTGIVQEQRYTIYRDLTSWVASLGAVIRDNDGVKDYGFLLTFTLKALPKFSFDLNYDPGSTGADATNTLAAPP